MGSVVAGVANSWVPSEQAKGGSILRELHVLRARGSPSNLWANPEASRGIWGSPCRLHALPVPSANLDLRGIDFR